MTELLPKGMGYLAVPSLLKYNAGVGRDGLFRCLAAEARQPKTLTALFHEQRIRFRVLARSAYRDPGAVCCLHRIHGQPGGATSPVRAGASDPGGAGPGYGAPIESAPLARPNYADSSHADPGTHRNIDGDGRADRCADQRGRRVSRTYRCGCNPAATSAAHRYACVATRYTTTSGRATDARPRSSIPVPAGWPASARPQLSWLLLYPWYSPGRSGQRPGGRPGPGLHHVDGSRGNRQQRRRRSGQV